MTNPTSFDAMDSTLIQAMTEYFSGDPKRIHHFLKVYGFARTIGTAEELSEETLHILCTSAIVHDIGIRPSEAKYGSSAGSYQELEGPKEAEKMLSTLGYPEALVTRVCYLVGHHHTYNQIDGIDYQILVEADFLVNAYEDQLDTAHIKNVRNRVFRTPSGIVLLENMYLS